MQSDDEVFAPETQRRTYQQVFHLAPQSPDFALPSEVTAFGTATNTLLSSIRPVVSRENWRIGTSWVSGYYAAAAYIVKGVTEGQLFEGIEGIPGVFLYRHYLELALKFIVFHARWLKDRNTNASADEVQAFSGNHSLAHWWSQVQKECPTRIERSVWESYDLGFVAECIAEFERYDPKGDGFRYHGSRFEVAKAPSTVTHELQVSYPALLENMSHCRDVLESIDMYLRESYGENEEWESYLNSL